MLICYKIRNEIVIVGLKIIFGITLLLILSKKLLENQILSVRKA
jgi:hypothetical protein